jgi:hypothetical protein
MAHSPHDPERITSETARRLLERASDFDEQELTLTQLREAALEAGISAEAFDAAVAEWRQGASVAPAPPVARTFATRWRSPMLRNLGALAAAYASLGLLVALCNLAEVPWLVRKLADPVGLALGLIIALRLRARPAAILIGGLSAATMVEFLLDLASGAPAIHGFRPHMALMIAGVAGAALFAMVRRRTSGPGSAGNSAIEGDWAKAQSNFDETGQRSFELLQPTRLASV